MAVKNTVKLNDRQWENLAKYAQASQEARAAFEAAATRLSMYVEMQAENADIDSELKEFTIDASTKSITFKKAQEVGPKIVETP